MTPSFSSSYTNLSSTSPRHSRCSSPSSSASSSSSVCDKDAPPASTLKRVVSNALRPPKRRDGSCKRSIPRPLNLKRSHTTTPLESCTYHRQLSHDLSRSMSSSIHKSLPPTPMMTSPTPAQLSFLLNASSSRVSGGRRSIFTELDMDTLSPVASSFPRRSSSSPAPAITSGNRSVYSTALSSPCPPTLPSPALTCTQSITAAAPVDYFCAAAAITSHSPVASSAASRSVSPRARLEDLLEMDNIDAKLDTSPPRPTASSIGRRQGLGMQSDIPLPMTTSPTWLPSQPKPTTSECTTEAYLRPYRSLHFTRHDGRVMEVAAADGRRSMEPLQRSSNAIGTAVLLQRSCGGAVRPTTTGAGAIVEPSLALAGTARASGTAASGMTLEDRGRRQIKRSRSLMRMPSWASNGGLGLGRPLNLGSPARLRNCEAGTPSFGGAMGILTEVASPVETPEVSTDGSQEVKPQNSPAIMEPQNEDAGAAVPVESNPSMPSLKRSREIAGMKRWWASLAARPIFSSVRSDTVVDKLQKSLPSKG